MPDGWSLEDAAWKTELPGRGHSSPVVWGDHVYLTSADDAAGKFYVVALNTADGAIAWTREYAFTPIRIHPLNSHASSSPTADEHGVYALLFGGDTSLVIAINHDGEEQWTHDLGPSATMHGPSLSPMIYEGKLIFSFEQEENSEGIGSAWFAFNTKSGNIAWKLERITGTKASSSTPCVYGDRIVFASQIHGITAVNPSDGGVAWEDASLLPTRVIGSPVVVDDVIFATCGVRGGGLKLVGVRAKDEVEVVHAIEERFIPYITTPVAKDGLLYTFHDRGEVTCVDVESGDVVWSDRRREKYFGSPIIVGDQIIALSDKGEVVVLKTGREYVELAKYDLGEECHSTPAFADGSLYLRTVSHLTCIEK